MNRLDKHECFMGIARLIAGRSACLHQQVGAVLINQNNHILAAAYNGPSVGVPHCTKETCLRKNIGSGQEIGTCYAAHAEMNAVLQCRDPYSIVVAYVTLEPCLMCTAILLNTSCKVIIYDKKYAGSGKEIWKKQNRLWVPFSQLCSNPKVIGNYLRAYPDSPMPKLSD